MIELIYQHPGDAMRHLERLRGLTGDAVALESYIPGYFNSENVRDLFTRRGDAIERLLRDQGHGIDHEFTTRPQGRKPRLGVLAQWFGPCAETYASLPYYEHLEGFDVTLYACAESGTDVEVYCRSIAGMVPMGAMSIADQVARIRHDDLDILLVATNVTAVPNNVCLLAAHRLARVQFTSAFSVVTSGLRNMDYFLSGTWTDPAEDAQDHYREKLVLMEGSCHCFSYPDDTIELMGVSRETLRVPADAIVYASGANYYKLTPELLQCWGKIIARVPNSVLMLMPYGPNWDNNYPEKEHAAWCASMTGIDPTRLKIIRTQTNRCGVREVMRYADIYLDSFPFSGTTSLVEPMQVGLPCVVMHGKTMRGSMGAAMIADHGQVSEEDYIQEASMLGNDCRVRIFAKGETENWMSDKPVFLDSRGFAERITPILKGWMQ